MKKEKIWTDLTAFFDGRNIRYMIKFSIDISDHGVNTTTKVDMHLPVSIDDTAKHISIHTMDIYGHIDTTVIDPDSIQHYRGFKFNIDTDTYMDEWLCQSYHKLGFELEDEDIDYSKEKYLIISDEKDKTQKYTYVFIAE